MAYDTAWLTNNFVKDMPLHGAHASRPFSQCSCVAASGSAFLYDKDINSHALGSAALQLKLFTAGMQF